MEVVVDDEESNNKGKSEYIFTDFVALMDGIMNSD